MPLLSWNTVTTNQDGSAISDLSFYTVYHGTVPNVWPDSTIVAQPTTSLTVTILNEEINNYYAVSATDTTGNEGFKSATITWPNRSQQLRVPVRYIRQYV